MSNDSAIYRFKAAARHQGYDIAEIEVRVPRMRDLKAIETARGNAGKAAKTIETLTGLTQREVDELHLDDVKGLGEVVAALCGTVQTPQGEDR